MSKRALPYRSAPPSSVEHRSWEILLDDDLVELPEALDDWDYRMNLSLRKSVTVDVDRLHQGTGLPPNAKFALAVVWTATGSGLKAAAQRVGLPASGKHTVDLAADLAGTQLGGLLTLDTVLVLAEAFDGPAASPRRAGSVLWSDRQILRLQGDAPQFPIAVVDFSKTQFPAGAGWYLQISGDLGTAAMGALLLLINERKRELVEAFERAAKPRPIDRVLLSAVYADVARTLLEHALREPEFVLDDDYPEESLGSTLQSLVVGLFPAVTVDHLRRRLEQSPRLFASELQDAVRIFEDVR